MSLKNVSILYNSDTTNIYMDRGYGLDRENLLDFVDEAADAGADAYVLCQGGQTFYYPSDVGEYYGQSADEETRTGWPEKLRRRVEAFERFLEKGVDPFGLLVQRIRERNMLALFSFRMNEGHTIPAGHPGVSKFWLDHPEWRINSADPVPFTDKWGGDAIRTRTMDFAVPEVRARRLAEIREAMTRYPFDGLELDFMRWPFFFKPEAIEQNAGLMTEFVRQVRALLDEIGRKRNQTLILGVRVQGTLAGARIVGLHPDTWHREKLLDFVVISHFFKNKSRNGVLELDIAEAKSLYPGIPVYGCIGITTPLDYLKRGKEIWEQGGDGIYLFNFFCTRQGGDSDASQEPPFHLLEELRQLGGVVQ